MECASDFVSLERDVGAAACSRCSCMYGGYLRIELMRRTGGFLVVWRKWLRSVVASSLPSLLYQLLSVFPRQTIITFAKNVSK